jgi:catechol 2,3-dioxygenase
MPNRLLSQLAHVEVLTPTPEESLRFYRDVLGLEESAREGQSVFLRGWGERFLHSLQLTESDSPGLGHIGWRTQGPDELRAAAARLDGAWVEPSRGQGDAYRYVGPGGHVHELFWEVERYVAPAGLESPFPNRPQRFVPRGVAARQIDHVTVATADPGADAAWYNEALGHRFMEYTVIPDRPDWIVFAMTTVCERAHDMGLVWDPSPIRGRLNHVAFWVDSRGELLRAADVLLNQDVAIEFGPGKHGMGEQDYLYFREPGGVRIELNSGGYRNYEPDFETIRYEPQQGSNVFYKNNALPHSMFESFPPVEFAPPEAEEAKAATGLFN